VLPQALIVLPAALALLAAPIGGPVTNARAVPALLGALAAGSIAAEAAIVVAATLAAAALVRGTLLERLTALLTAAAGLALAWVVHGPFAELARLLPDELPVRSASVLANPVAPIAAGVVLGTASLFARDAARPQRVALMAATLAGCACVFFFVWKVSSTRGFPAGLWIAVSAATPPGLVLLAAAANALGPAVRWLVALALLAACAWFVRHPPAPPEPAAAGILAQARAVAQPGSALAVHGDTRVGMAVYARLGHAPAMPLIHVPEQAPFAGLADFCRRLGVRQLWVHPPLPEAPPGFSSPESRPGGAADLTYLVVEQS
jgi:hypothetical protein